MSPDARLSLTTRLAPVAKPELKPSPRPLEVELEEKLLRREAEREVEEHLAREDFPSAVHALRKLRPGEPDRQDAFDNFLGLDPERGLLYEVRSALYREAKRGDAAARDLVRAVLVTESREVSLEILERLSAMEKVELQPWMAKALSAVSARLQGDRPVERRLLLEAIRGAPDELCLFAALARCEAKSCSDVELFALRHCVRCAPGWLEARIELFRAAKAIGDFDAMRIEVCPRAHEPRGTRREVVHDVSLEGHRRRGRKHGAA